MFANRSIALTTATMLFIGCEGEATRLGSLPEAEPAVLEPGYVLWPPAIDFRRLYSTPSCGTHEPRKSTSPTIEILSSGGIEGSGTGNIQIWDDGTVMFDGVGCRNFRRRRGKMSPARVRAVIDKLDEARFFTWHCNDEVRCADSYITSLTVQRGDAVHTVVDTGCDSNQDLAAQAIELVMTSVGKNACSPECLDVPTAPRCR